MKKTSQKGFIRATLIIVGALVVLKYAYDIDVVEFLTTGNFRKILDKFYNLGSAGWEKYRELILKVWDYIWTLAKNTISKIKN
ncbi:MAG TPA: hypothetical protein VJB58_02745 [Candidatus Paceibacterota bacterium]